MQSGQQIRDYVLDSKIGEGGMGQVWRAHHLVLERKVAIKAMTAQVATDPEFEKRFVQEARAQANLSHPRILGVNDFFIHDQTYYLVMPLVEGESLEVQMERLKKPLPLDETLALAHDLLDALDYAHQRGIIHRDVKPSNILLDADGRAYLMDFGIALLVGQDRRTRTGTSLGTPHYMSPEQIRHPKSIDHRTDVYSVGCVLYEALTGRPPFLPKDHGDTDFQVKEAHLYEQAQPIHALNPAVPQGLDNLVMRALAKDPAERYGGCGEFLRALNAFRYQGVAPPPPPGRIAIPRPAPSRPQQAVAAAGPRPPVAKKGPSKALWFVLGGGAAGCLMLVAVIMLGLYFASQVDEPEAGPPFAAQEPAFDQEAVDHSVTPPAPGGGGDGDQRFREQIEDQLLLNIAVYTAQGYTETHNPYIDRLAPDATDSVNFRLQTGNEYVVIGVCDTDCDDLDLRLKDENGNTIDEDFATDDFPTVEVTPAWTGQFDLEVVMADCDEPYCYYGVAIYGK